MRKPRANGALRNGEIDMRITILITVEIEPP